MKSGFKLLPILLCVYLPIHAQIGSDSVAIKIGPEITDTVFILDLKKEETVQYELSLLDLMHIKEFQAPTGTIAGYEVSWKVRDKIQTQNFSGSKNGMYKDHVNSIRNNILGLKHGSIIYLNHIYVIEAGKGLTEYSCRIKVK